MEELEDANLDELKREEWNSGVSLYYNKKRNIIKSGFFCEYDISHGP
jgi:hypothetical protein